MEIDYAKLTRGLLASYSKNPQAALAKEIGVEQATVSRWLKGSMPKTPQAKKLENLGRRRGLIGEDDRTPDFDDTARRPTSGIVEIDVRAGLGAGGTTEGREVRHDGDHSDPLKSESWHFPSRFMREEIRATESQVIILETDGDSMEPTIGSGERIIVHTGMKTPSPDGIFALRDVFGNIIAKRLQVLRKGDPPRILIISDNKSHPTEEVGLDEINIVGRVLWGLKRL